MPTDTIWVLEQHTAAKHRLLRRYLDAWFPIMASVNAKVLYLDAFAGPGKYAGGEDGSPIVALKSLLEHSHFDRLSGTEFLFLFLEADQARWTNLKAEVEALLDSRPGGRPPNVTAWVEHATFAEAAENILTGIADRALAPTFAFIDPFGWKGVPLDLISRLLASPRCEVLMNFMIEAVNRWVTADNNEGVATTIESLFGTDAYKGAPIAGPERQDYLVDLYESGLRDEAHFRFVRSFEMVNRRGKTGYYLVYGTRHPKGLEVMKGAMWKVDPECGRRYSTIEAGSPSLFADRANVAPLREELRACFKGMTVAVEVVASYVSEVTDYLATSHLKRLTLVPMEAAGEITVQRAPNRRGFHAGCRITFP